MLVMALVISSVAAYFSVVGLAALFAATAGAVVVMGVALEAGKLATAGWIHSNWNNPKVNWLLRSYLVIAVMALMLITSLGIYGFLSRGHIEQSSPLASIELEISTKQADIDAVQADLTSQKERLSQLDAAVNSMIGGDKAERGLKYRHIQSGERVEIQKAITKDVDKIQEITKEITPLKLQVNDVETKLGPVKYVAALFGLKDTEAAVRIVILIIMFAFDPLAVVMILSAFISLSDAMDDRHKGTSRDDIVIDSITPKPSVLQGGGIGRILTEEEGRAALDAYMDWCETPEGQAHLNKPIEESETKGGFGFGDFGESYEGQIPLEQEHILVELGKKYRHG